MNPVSTDNFGLLIAYLVPGFVSLLGVSLFSETVQAWLGIVPLSSPTVGGFLYVTLASIAAGLIVSAVRWTTVDRLHHHTGIPEPTWNFARLPATLPAFMILVENHYRYYQFYANMLVAAAFCYLAYLFAWSVLPGQDLPLDAGFLGIEVVLLLGSRDTLRKYYTRGAALLLAGPRYSQDR